MTNPRLSNEAVYSSANMIICLNVNTGLQRFLYEHDQVIAQIFVHPMFLISTSYLEKETEFVVWDLNQSNGKVITKL